MSVFKLFLFACTICCLLVSPVFAEGIYGGLGIGLSSSRISTWNDDDTTGSINIYGGYSFSKHISLEAGYVMFSDIKVDSARDFVGEYSLEFERDDVYLGPAFQFKPKYFIPIRLMVGVTYSMVKMTVKESFNRWTQEMSTSRDDEVMGVYLSLGIVPFEHPQVSSVFSIEYLHRPDVFSSSDRNFDSDELIMRCSVSFK